MKLVRSIDSAALPRGGCVCTIGNFDAVHIGHQQIIARLRKEGDRRGLPVVVMTFDPHPDEYFLGDMSSARLTDCSTRYFALKALGVDVMLSLPFNRELASTSAEAFIADYLADALGVRFLLIGDDFQFGRGRLGTLDTLRDAADDYGYAVTDTRTIEFSGSRVSSSRIRQLLEAGELEKAASLLGRPYNLVGRVTYGQRLGRQWGFPTLNIPVHHRPAVTGVFAVQVRGVGDDAYSGVANLGTRPTVGGQKTLLEVHLFDFSEEIYGRRICVEFIEKIRAEQKFESFDELKLQIQRDTGKARQIMQSRSRVPT